MNNPLLKIGGLPLFASISPADIEPAVDQVLDECRLKINQLLESTEAYNWENIIQPIEQLHDRLQRVWSPISHLHAVADSGPLRKAYNACLPKVSLYQTELLQNKALYAAYKCVAESSAYETFNDAQKMLLKNALVEFKLSGVALNDSKRQEYKSLKQRLFKLQTEFEENLLDATEAWEKHVTDEAVLSGLPESVLQSAKQQASSEGKPGWVLTLDFPFYMPIMKYADNADLRQEVYCAHNTLASDQATDRQWDNSVIMDEILLLRQRQARLLGYQTYADYSLETKMAKDSDEVLDFLHDLAKRSMPMAVQELEELQAFATAEFGLGELCAWDISYYAEKLRQKKYQLAVEDLRPYFSVDQVISGLFAVVQRLYGLEVKQREQVETWHGDVRFFDVFDEAGVLRGSFYFDLYARKGKRGGAWVSECIMRNKTHVDVQLPVAYVNCNFTPTVGDAPSLLTHDEVITLFHEFGHALHHILTLVDYPSVAGINGVAWDVVELPSQFMENWCWQSEALGLIGRHYQTGEPISDELWQKMINARNFHSGMQMLRQLEFALFDWQLHLAGADGSKVDIQALLNAVRKQVAVVASPAYNRFQNSFAHVFAGDYAAGYYSYKWAEVLSADSFSRFEQEGIFNRNVGSDFLHSILEQGGAKEPIDMFVNFMGRMPKIDALLQHSGISG